jgi:hypothetical protein
MKKFLRFLPLVGLLAFSAGTVVNATKAAAPRVSSCPSWGDGQQDGQARKASLEAQYGAGTPAYDEALAAAIEQAHTNATTGPCPHYWRGYEEGLTY